MITDVTRKKFGPQKHEKINTVLVGAHLAFNHFRAFRVFRGQCFSCFIYPARNIRN